MSRYVATPMNEQGAHGDAAPGRARQLFSFPNPVNEVAARTVAAGGFVMCVVTVALDVRWATAIIAYGFVARVLTGPTLSPLGQVATRLVAPRLASRAKLIPGPPKRFAQAVGLTFSVPALALTLAGDWTPAAVLLGLVAVAAFLEAALAICLGCMAFGLLMRWGLVPAEVCESCNNIWAGKAAATAHQAEPFPLG